MKNKKLLLALAALVAVVAVLLGVYFATRPQGIQGEKTVTVTVVHKDGSEKSFTCHTDAEFLDKVLLDENIVVGEKGEFGLYFQTADGETVEGEGWWKVCIGDEAASTGASQIPVTDGASYKLVYTVGW
ncbi:MAG: hypothetical protein J6Q53_01655 [Oscillospiraceae bacterium]|nr:hypothetical protein [Oscillospiraceae bacterium]